MVFPQENKTLEHQSLVTTPLKVTFVKEFIVKEEVKVVATFAYSIKHS